jgi:phage tail protein X
MKKKNKKNGQVKSSSHHSNSNSSVKQISFDTLHRISLENYGRFNQNVWTEKLLESNPGLSGSNVILQKIMEHNHFIGSPIEQHYRCIVHIPNKSDFLLQDVSIGQWNSF